MPQTSGVRALLREAAQEAPFWPDGEVRPHPSIQKSGDSRCGLHLSRLLFDEALAERDAPIQAAVTAQSPWPFRSCCRSDDLQIWRR